MIALSPDAATLDAWLARKMQRPGTYDSRTGQSGQTGQHIENATEYSSRAGQDLSDCPLKLASGTGQRSNPDVQVAGARIDSTHAPSSGTGPQP